MHEYVMDSRIYTKLKNRGHDLKCYRCGKPIKIGDRVCSLQAGHKGRKTRIYHIKCYEDMFYDPKLRILEV